MWTYYYRAVDKQGNTVDFFLSNRRNKTAAKRFLAKAINRNSQPSIVNIDKSGANKAAFLRYNFLKRKRIKIRQSKYLNNIVEQDHRFIKKMTRPMLGFKSQEAAAITLAGIEVVQMIRKSQIYSMILTQFSRFVLTAAHCICTKAAPCLSTEVDLEKARPDSVISVCIGVRHERN